jgi:integrase
VGDDWDAAHEAASKIRVKLKLGDFTFLQSKQSTPPTELTLEQAIRAWLEHRRAFDQAEASTDTNYLQLLAKHVFPALGHRAVIAISRDHLVELFGQLLSGTAPSTGGRKLSKSLCRQLRAPIRQTYEWLIYDKRMDLQNPAVRFGRLLHERVDKKKHVKPLTVAEESRLLAAAAKHARRYYALFLLAVRAGLRLSELFGLKWQDIDLATRTVRVERQYRDGREVDRTKRNKVRDVDLSGECCKALAAHRLRFPSPEFIFLTRLRQPIKSRSSFRRRVLLPLAAKAGITRDLKFQYTRQTYATGVIETSGDLQYASEQLGHASTKITSDYYGTSRDPDRTKVDALDRRMARHRATPRRHLRARRAR